MIKLIIFDFDGLMVNSENIIFSAIQKIYSGFGHHFTWNYFQKHLGKTVTEALTSYYQDYPINISFEEFVELRHIEVKKALKNELRLQPGLIPLLEFLKKSRIKMVIASSSAKKYLQDNLNKFKIADYFSAIYGRESITRSKPHPEIFLHALKEARISASQAIILEDSPLGVVAGNSAGIFTIAVPMENVESELFNKADLVFKNLHQVREFFLKNSIKIPQSRIRFSYQDRQ